MQCASPARLLICDSRAILGLAVDAVLSRQNGRRLERGMSANIASSGDFRAEDLDWDASNN